VLWWYALLAFPIGLAVLLWFRANGKGAGENGDQKPEKQVPAKRDPTMKDEEAIFEAIEKGDLAWVRAPTPRRALAARARAPCQRPRGRSVATDRGLPSSLVSFCWILHAATATAPSPDSRGPGSAAARCLRRSGGTRRSLPPFCRGGAGCGRGP